MSLYNSLRTNLPRESMGILDYPFSTRRSFGDSRRFPGHREVLRYLESFARDFDLYGLVRFRTEVVRVEMREEDCRRAVLSKAANEGGDWNEVYDAVVVCNGHYTEPRLADIPGVWITNFVISVDTFWVFCLQNCDRNCMQYVLFKH